MSTSPIMSGMNLIPVPSGSVKMASTPPEGTPINKNRKSQVDGFYMTQGLITNAMVDQYIEQMNGQKYGLIGFHSKTGRPFVLGRTYSKEEKNIEFTMPYTTAQIALGRKQNYPKMENRTPGS